MRGDEESAGFAVINLTFCARTSLRDRVIGAVMVMPTSLLRGEGRFTPAT